MKKGGKKRGTRERLLDVAERLFARSGFKETSLRTITRKAKANLAAVHYHFGSKETLTQAVFIRRLAPLNRKRLNLLDDTEKAAGDGPVELEEILRAFIAPTIHLWRDQPHFMQLAGRLHWEPDQKLHTFFLEQFEEVILRFSAALAGALPDLPPADFFWRAHFLIGAMIYTWTSYGDLERVSGGICTISDFDRIIERLVAFGAAGLRAPLAQQKKDTL